MCCYRFDLASHTYSVHDILSILFTDKMKSVDEMILLAASVEFYTINSWKALRVDR